MHWKTPCSYERYLMNVIIVWMSFDWYMTKLEIWGKAQRESVRRPKSDWVENLRGRGWNSPCSKVMWPTLKCIGIRKTRTDYIYTDMYCKLSKCIVQTPQQQSKRRFWRFGRKSADVDPSSVLPSQRSTARPRSSGNSITSAVEYLPARNADLYITRNTFCGTRYLG